LVLPPLEDHGIEIKLKESDIKPIVIRLIFWGNISITPYLIPEKLSPGSEASLRLSVMSLS
jgi:hypothetical protein